MHGLHKGLTQPGALELGHGIGERSHAGQDHVAGMRTDPGPELTSAVPHGLDGLLHAPKIAHSIIDDRNHAG